MGTGCADFQGWGWCGYWGKDGTGREIQLSPGTGMEMPYGIWKQNF